eukprot:5305137-Pyramimonas_sp.AAC.1
MLPASRAIASSAAARASWGGALGHEAYVTQRLIRSFWPHLAANTTPAGVGRAIAGGSRRGPRPPGPSPDCG